MQPFLPTFFRQQNDSNAISGVLYLQDPVHDSRSALMLIDGFRGPNERLTDEDFPPNFVNGKHPLDYIPVTEPILPEQIVHKFSDGERRMIFRISWKVGKIYIPMTFLLDFRYPHLYVTYEAYELLVKHDLVSKKGDEFDCYSAKIHYGAQGEEIISVLCELSNGPANILGVRAILKLGLHLKDEGFSFDRNAPWF